MYQTDAPKSDPPKLVETSTGDCWSSAEIAFGDCTIAEFKSRELYEFVTINQKRNDSAYHCCPLPLSRWSKTNSNLYMGNTNYFKNYLVM